LGSQLDSQILSLRELISSEQKIIAKPSKEPDSVLLTKLRFGSGVEKQVSKSCVIITVRMEITDQETQFLSEAGSDADIGKKYAIFAVLASTIKLI
jgi:hypothetical protein